MKRSYPTVYILVAITLLLSNSNNCAAQIFDFFDFTFPQFEQNHPQGSMPRGYNQSQMPIKPLFNLNYENYFDNREFERSQDALSESQTPNAVRISPEIGLEVKQNSQLSHKIKLGIDIMKNMGETPVTAEDKALQNWDLFREITLYYQIDANLGRKTHVQGVTGAFPRKYLEGDYSRVFFSDSLKYFDNNVEGMILKVSSNKTYGEIGLDWHGKYAKDRKERFVIFSHVEYAPKDWFSVGGSLTYHHHAASEMAPGVVDNGLLEPFVKFDLSKKTPLDRFSAKLGWIQGVQNDRELIDVYIYPRGAELTLDVNKWNLGVEQVLFYGTNMMPYYLNKDTAGHTYGKSLYLGSPMYRVSKSDTWNKFRPYYRLETYYRPRISSFVDLNVSVVLHFNNKFLGSEQKFGLLFDLERISNDPRINPFRKESAKNRSTSRSTRAKSSQRVEPKGLQRL